MNHRGRHSFVLLEVLIAMTILGLTIAAVLRSFSQSLGAVTQIEARTKAMFFARQLFDEFEREPPTEGKKQGGFGDAYWQFHYELSVEYVEPKYEGIDVPKEIESLCPLRLYTLEIYYDNNLNRSFRALRVRSAIVGAEPFSATARRELHEY